MENALLKTLSRICVQEQLFKFQQRSINYKARSDATIRFTIKCNEVLRESSELDTLTERNIIEDARLYLKAF